MSICRKRSPLREIQTCLQNTAGLKSQESFECAAGGDIGVARPLAKERSDGRPTRALEQLEDGENFEVGGTEGPAIDSAEWFDVAWLAGIAWMKVEQGVQEVDDAVPRGRRGLIRRRSRWRAEFVEARVLHDGLEVLVDGDRLRRTEGWSYA